MDVLPHVHAAWPFRGTEVAVAFDAVGPSVAGSGGSSLASTSWSHTCTGSNRVVVVGVAVGVQPDAGVTATATYNSVSMTSLGLVHSDNSNAGFVQLFGLVNPPTGAQTVLVTPSATATLSAGSISFTGASGFGTAVTAFGSSAAPSVAVTGTTSGNMVVDAACCGSTAGFSSSTQTNRWLKNTDGATGAGDGAGSTAAAGGSVTMSYAITSDFWGVVAVEVIAATNAPPAPGLLVSRLRPYFG